MSADNLVEHPLCLNPSLAGEWLEEKLYLVDIERAQFFLLSGPASFFVSRLNAGDSSTDAQRAFRAVFGGSFSASQIAELCDELVLLREAQPSLVPIAMPPRPAGLPSRLAGEISPVFLEKGIVETRIVATGITTIPPMS